LQARQALRPEARPTVANAKSGVPRGLKWLFRPGLPEKYGFAAAPLRPKRCAGQGSCAALRPKPCARQGFCAALTPKPCARQGFCAALMPKPCAGHGFCAACAAEGSQSQNPRPPAARARGRCCRRLPKAKPTAAPSCSQKRAVSGPGPGHSTGPNQKGPFHAAPGPGCSRAPRRPQQSAPRRLRGQQVLPKAPKAKTHHWERAAPAGAKRCQRLPKPLSLHVSRRWADVSLPKVKVWVERKRGWARLYSAVNQRYTLNPKP
jgi:hypothetical protein